MEDSGRGGNSSNQPCKMKVPSRWQLGVLRPFPVALEGANLLVSSLMNTLACVVLSCCGCLCFRSSLLCPPLCKELYVGTIIHTVPTARRFDFRIAPYKKLFSRTREECSIFFANNNSSDPGETNTKNREVGLNMTEKEEKQGGCDAA
jgi:hypothetical protein